MRGPGSTGRVRYELAGPARNRSIVRTQSAREGRTAARRARLAEGPLELEFSYLGQEGWQETWDGGGVPLCVRVDVAYRFAQEAEQRFSRTVPLPCGGR